LAPGFRDVAFDWKAAFGEICGEVGEDERQDVRDVLSVDLEKVFSTETNLIFGDSKALLESLLERISKRADSQGRSDHPFVIHHGSLSRSLRESTEARLKSGQPTTAFCTSTLEMGIDIGSVRAVGQINPPWTVASMVQRLGRSGRRAGVPAIMRVYTLEKPPTTRGGLMSLLYPSVLRSVALTRLMIQKWVEPFDNRQLHLSTMIQQLMSCLKQSGGVSAEALFETLCVKGAFRNIDQAIFAATLRALGESEIVEQMPQGDLILNLEGERLAAEVDFYAAFMGSEELTLRHRGEDLGQLPSSAIPAVGECLTLGGRSWRVEEIVESSKRVYVAPGQGGGGAPAFRGRGAEVHSRVIREMKTVLEEDDKPAFLDDAGRTLLRAARTFARESGLLEDGILQAGTELVWFPWRGTRCLTTLQMMAAACGFSVTGDALSVRIKTKDLSELKPLLEKEFSAEELAARLPVKTQEKYDGLLSEELLVAARAADQIDLDEAREALAELAAGLGIGEANNGDAAELSTST
jgi:ATP-dependent Lhr-like helicase